MTPADMSAASVSTDDLHCSLFLLLVGPLWVVYGLSVGDSSLAFIFPLVGLAAVAAALHTLSRFGVKPFLLPLALPVWVTFVRTLFPAVSSGLGPFDLAVTTVWLPYGLSLGAYFITASF